MLRWDHWSSTTVHRPDDRALGRDPGRPVPRHLPSGGPSSPGSVDIEAPVDAGPRTRQRVPGPSGSGRHAGRTAPVGAPRFVLTGHDSTTTSARIGPCRCGRGAGAGVLDRAARHVGPSRRAHQPGDSPYRCTTSTSASRPSPRRRTVDLPRAMGPRVPHRSAGVELGQFSSENRPGARRTSTRRCCSPATPASANGTARSGAPTSRGAATTRSWPPSACPTAGAALQLGELLHPGEIALAPGESYRRPR